MGTLRRTVKLEVGGEPSLQVNDQLMLYTSGSAFTLQLDTIVELNFHNQTVCRLARLMQLFISRLVSPSSSNLSGRGGGAGAGRLLVAVQTQGLMATGPHALQT